MNYYLHRVKQYNPAGRNQTAEESDVIALEIENYLAGADVSYTILKGNESAVATVVEDVEDALAKMGVVPNAY